MLLAIIQLMGEVFFYRCTQLSPNLIQSIMDIQFVVPDDDDEEHRQKSLLEVSVRCIVTKYQAAFSICHCLAFDIVYSFLLMLFIHNKII